MSRAQRFLLAAGLLVGLFFVLGGVNAVELSGSSPGVIPAPRPPDRYPIPIDPPPIWRRPFPMHVGLEVLVDGQPVRTVEYQGRTYLPVSRLGAEYEIRVWNHGANRVAALVSVDGLSVITGKPASEDDPGYLVSPGQPITIKGWRRDLDTVAAFSFEHGAQSYAARMGHPENIGVIGLVAFEERTWRPRPLPRPLFEEKTAGATGASRAYDLGSTGTGYGRDVDSKARYVPFVRSGNRRSVTVYYDTVEALRRIGVPVDDPHPVPFPGDFAPPPPGPR